MLLTSLERYATLYLLTALPLLFARIPPSEAVILPLHFFALFCLGYISHFVSKNLPLFGAEKEVGDYFPHLGVTSAESCPYTMSREGSACYRQAQLP